jgi:hypothetical protein
MNTSSSIIFRMDSDLKDGEHQNKYEYQDRGHQQKFSRSIMLQGTTPLTDVKTAPGPIYKRYDTFVERKLSSFGIHPTPSLPLFFICLEDQRPT